MTDLCLHINPSFSSPSLVEEFSISTKNASQNILPKDTNQSRSNLNNNKGINDMINYDPNMFDLNEDDVMSIKAMDKKTTKIYKNSTTEKCSVGITTRRLNRNQHSISMGGI